MVNKAVMLTSAAIAGTALVLLITKSAQAAPPPPTEGKANLYGKVKDASTGAALAGVEVNLSGTVAMTDSGGDYSFLDIEPGEYTLIFSKEGYDTLTL